MTEPTPDWTSPGGERPPPTAEPTPGAAGDWQPAGGWTQPGWGQPGWGQPRPPEPKPGVVPLRPLGLGELLDGAVALVRRYPRPVLGLSAALAIISTVLNVTLAVTVFRPLIDFDISTFDSSGSTSTDEVDGFFGGALLGSLGSSLVTALATVILTGVVTVVAGRGVLGEPITLGEAWSVVRSALGRLIGLSLLIALLVYGSLAVGVTLAIVLVAALGPVSLVVGLPVAIAAVGLTVYLYCRLALAPCSLILERAGIRTSLRRSGVLVGGAWWRVFGVLLLAWFVAMIVANVIQAPFLVFGLGKGLLSGDALADGISTLLVLSYIGAGIAQTVIAPFSAGVRALLYVDRRMRAEGLDVALTAAAARQVA
ncbi:MAG: hypothetical protein QOE05_3119 [Actinomycetota bacterium]|jgi:hypothetical protein|nr:hypothetical protein [Actinomycetota bacterium]